MRRLHVMVLCLLLIVLSAAGAGAQNGKPGGSQPFASFWAKFKTAVAKSDREAVASMTKLPFGLNNEQLDKAGFIKSYDSIFDRRIRKCFAAAKPVKDGETYMIFCGEQIFLFAKVDGEYKFTEIGAND